MQSACIPISGGETLNQLTKVRLPSGSEVAIVDWSYRPLYSTIVTLDNWTDQELNWFTYSIGDQVSLSTNLLQSAGGPFNATLHQTNLRTASEMDSLEEYLVYAMSVELVEYGFTQGAYTLAGPGTPAPNLPVMVLLQTFIVELEVSDKEYYQAPLGWFTQGYGPSFNLDAGLQTGRTYAFNGLPSAEAIDASPVPVHIGGTEKFRGILHNPGGAAVRYRDDAGNAVTTAVVAMRLLFRGLQKRPAG